MGKLDGPALSRLAAFIGLRTEMNASESVDTLRNATPQPIHAMALALNAKDPYTGEHQRRVSELAAAIGKEMGLSDADVKGVVLAALLHDLGKTHIPSSILHKPDRLNSFEYSIIKNHSQFGHQMLREARFAGPIAEAVLQHHERLDGSGYPHGLHGEQILLPARIIGVADVVEAMVSDRPYRPGMTMDMALEHILQSRRILYDDRVVHACMWVCAIKGFEFS